MPAFSRPHDNGQCAGQRCHARGGVWFDRWQASCNDVGVTYDAIDTWSAGRQLRHISMLTGEAHGFRASNGVHAGSSADYALNDGDIVGILDSTGRL